ncbi:MAG: glycosyltransferase [Patescibacteria group bacterium]
MKLLILTQKVDINDDVLGFFHGWLEEFSKHCQQVIVICLKKGEYKLPKNVKVLSLGKEEFDRFPGHSFRIFRWFIYSLRFYKHIWGERKNYDKVFVHMNKEYVLVGGIFWKLWHKKISLWYAHKAVSWQLWLAEKMVNTIFTATCESFRLASNKVNIIGHGIDGGRFKNYELEIKNNIIFKIITIGRISPSKDYETLIKAVEILNKAGVKLQVDIVGGPGTSEQKKYFNKIKEMAGQKKLGEVINFIGSVPNKDIYKYLNQAELFVHMSLTGSLDKAILEAMASGLIVVSCNDSSYKLLEDYKKDLLFKKGDHKELATKIERIIKWPPGKTNEVAEKLQKIVINNHNLKKLIKKIVFLCN